MRKFGRFGIGSALAMVGCVALGAGAFALATSDGDTVTQVAGESGGGGPEGYPRGPFMGDRGAPQFRGRPDFRGWPGFRRPSSEDILKRRSRFAKELAAELGKEQEEVEKALRNVFKKHLDEVVQDEDLTQKQADRILECYDSAKCGPFGFGGGPPHAGPGGPHPGM